MADRATHHEASFRAKPARGKSRQPGAALRVHYTVSMPDPASHTFHVKARVEGAAGRAVLAFPAWTPGSYKLREFAKNVSAFTVKGGSFEMLDKQRFEVFADKDAFTASYTLYADELSVRTPHLDDSHGFFLGTNIFPFIEGPHGLPADCEYTVNIKPWRKWQVATSLPPVKGQANTWRASSYDILGDTPFEIGTHSVHSFKVDGIRHDVAIYGYGNFDIKRILEDTRKVVKTQADAMGGLPYDYYLFIHHITPDSGGGLEHLNSCVCGWKSFKFKKEEDYQAFIRLVSHEFFHVWNVKRIRPEVLGPFDYSKEQYTKALWVMEGLTQYYERLWCTRAGITPVETLLQSYAETIEREDARPGRKVMSLENASWLAWTKLYLADENYLNTGISYYSRGAQVGLLLDAKIRKATAGKRSLDDVMRLAMQRHGWPKPGFAERGFEAMCEEVAGTRFTQFWRDHVRGTKELDYSEFLEVYGLEFARDKSGVTTDLGIKLDGQKVTAVHAEGPGRKAGLQPRDEIIAFDGHKVSGKSLEDHIHGLRPGESVQLSLFRRERLVNATLTAQSQPAGKLLLRPTKKQTAQQRKNFESWVGRV
ncbi:MAG: M61 family metallopeptidase [Planctomycetes bacterium]|nr:M61 family metallopeptidase [Planctomycetota bacterium]MCW8137224.1 M61 family metallopeptidase [Planctomycetota bacterium]